MTVLQTIAVAFAMFSALPVPQFDWNEKNMRYALCAFPLIGVVMRRAVVRSAASCPCRSWPGRRRSASCRCAVTGGIHLDGYADTCDALSSYGDREKKLEILKDPHCGAFAVIRLCSYFVAYFGLCACVRFTPRVGCAWTLALVLERALSGLCGGGVPLAKNTGLAHTFATAADKQPVRRVLAGCRALLAVALTALGGGLGWRRLRFCALCTTISWPKNSLAASPAIWPGGFCKRPSSGCWRRWPPASGGVL